MDRFEWSDGQLAEDEVFVFQRSGVALYDGQEKTPFESGTLMLTTHRLIWRGAQNNKYILSLPLSLCVYIEEHPSRFARSAKIVAHLHEPLPNKPSGPMSQSSSTYVRFSFRESGEKEFFRYFKEQLEERKFEKPSLGISQITVTSPRHRPGIIGIERAIQKKREDTDKNISQAFEDLSNLIEKAKEMVLISNMIANKIKEKQDVTEDETIRFKSYLLSMGIPNPVTRETHGTGDRYYLQLAQQLNDILKKPIAECGGMMTLTDVYCRVNRARGMELLSPEDLLHACEIMESSDLDIRLRIFDSGVMVLQSQSHNEEQAIERTIEMVEQNGSLTAEELSQCIGVSVILAKERLLFTEKFGGICRDESIEGLRFYPNNFLNNEMS
ncbi:vacuolar protein-sorting-associated protein 36 isoform X1 [Octopus bimaculoides]|uniref:Vacuolar protein-sorting-associated protein 36 n=2 Tax=Octopus bimaculoides TaxID=37653 RepID=A0A0L8GKY7_OCTBM|nr:vacuolar protein-sorting-associated protein 36 isoform X1 [Octopus bimaculoides]|eukprot:XP_014780159.1 PREDICTED: vacuolar protein-sorting-associated protein 36-like isoform X1 [Octopus bimaculoides]